MNINDIVRLPDPRKSVKAAMREVIHDVDDKPRRMVRVRLTGWHFPERAPEPFMVIGAAVSSFVRISPDGLTADAYFDNVPPAARQVSFGYGNVVSWDFPSRITPARIGRIDPSTLPARLAKLLAE